MTVRIEKRKRSANGLKFHCQRRRRIGDAAIVRGVEIEFDRTLPFWRCFTDLRLESGRKPEVTQRKTQLIGRIPCRVFKGVNVVWARTQVELRQLNDSKSTPTRLNGTHNNGKDGFSVEQAENRHLGSNTFTAHYIIDTLHFVHNDAYRKGTGSEHSFHVQSVILRDAPTVLQCVAGAMVSFSFLIFTSLRIIHACKEGKCHIYQLGRELEPAMHACTHQAEKVSVKHVEREGIESTAFQTASALFLRGVGETHATEKSAVGTSTELRRLCPPSTSRILILGMGGNSMALALRAVLGPEALIEVVEVEPAVVTACIRMGTLDMADSNTKVYLQDADACLRTLPDRVYDFVFMDIFEPRDATMKNLHPWVAAAREKLVAGGLLVMNEHQLPSAERLAPYGKLFGDGNVQAVNLRGWNESVVVCVAPGSSETDAYTLEVSKSHTDLAFNIYEALVPGWLPHFSWLVRAKTHSFEKMRFRLWTS